MDEDTNEECEAKGCDIPPGHFECRRCGAEVVEDEDTEARNPAPAVPSRWTADIFDYADWHTEDEDTEADTHPDCEAEGCVIPDGYAECRRCGAELIEDE